MIVRKGISAMSDKRRAEQQQYARAKQLAWNRDKGQCQAAEVWGDVSCAGRLDPHHIRAKSTCPELRNDPDNLIVLCRMHHDETHRNPLRARALGLIK